MKIIKCAIQNHMLKQLQTYKILNLNEIQSIEYRLYTFNNYIIHIQ